jgi:hypothetical protein
MVGTGPRDVAMSREIMAIIKQMYMVYIEHVMRILIASVVKLSQTW